MSLNLKTAKVALEGLLERTIPVAVKEIRAGTLKLTDESEASIKSLEDFIKEEEVKLASTAENTPAPTENQAA